MSGKFLVELKHLPGQYAEFTKIFVQIKCVNDVTLPGSYVTVFGRCEPTFEEYYLLSDITSLSAPSDGRDDRFKIKRNGNHEGTKRKLEGR